MLVLEVTDDTIVRKFKEQLRRVQPSQDIVIRRLNKVDVIVGKKLTKDDETVVQAGISPEAVVLVNYSLNLVECGS